MARLIYSLLFLFFVSPIVTGGASAQEFLSGQIIKANIETMEIVIGSYDHHNRESGSQQRILIRPAKDNILPKQGGKSLFPDCVIEGDQIRIWGDWQNGEQDVFLAHDIRGCKGGGCSDPTGIMSRLKRFSESRRKNMGNSRSGRGARHRGGHK